jgi:hypothetical protein
MTELINRLIPMNSNTKNNEKKTQKKGSYFSSNEHNYDVNQSLDVLNKKENLENKTNLDKMNNNNLNSINDSIDYLGCLNNNCSNLNNNQNNQNDKNNKENVEMLFSLEINNNSNKDNNNESGKTKNEGIFQTFMKNLDILISFVYIFLISLLIISAVMNRNNMNLVQIIILTLLYIFYKIYLSKN